MLEVWAASRLNDAMVSGAKVAVTLMPANSCQAVEGWGTSSTKIRFRAETIMTLVMDSFSSDGANCEARAVTGTSQIIAMTKKGMTYRIWVPPPEVTNQNQKPKASAARLPPKATTYLAVTIAEPYQKTAHAHVAAASPPHRRNAPPRPAFTTGQSRDRGT